MDTSQKVRAKYQTDPIPHTTRADYIALDQASQRRGPGGTVLNYIETYEVINIMNAKFGTNGWTSQILQLSDLNGQILQPGVKQTSYEYMAIVRITIIQNGQHHDGTGIGSGVLRETVIKEAESDAFKRAARYFGNEFGNCLYDKEYSKVAPKTTTTSLYELDD